MNKSGAMKKKPLVTVLMAVYNGEKHLKLTIESILNQTFKDFEFVIVNDGSTDSTADIIKSYKDSRIILHNNKINIGQTKSLNVGLNISKGKYIARTDAGDISLHMRLKKQVKYLENYPEITLLGTSAFRYNEVGKIINVVRMPSSKAAILQRIFFTTPVVHVSVLMRREVILSLGGYDENYHILADYELWSRLLKRRYCLTNLMEILVGYMLSPNSFGEKNAHGKSFGEACKIIQANINKFSNMPISYEQASNIHKMFNFDMEGMTFRDMLDGEKLFTDVLKEMGGSKSDINYLLTRKYLKYLLLNIKKPTDKSKFRYAIRIIFSKGIYLLLSERCLEAPLRLCQSILWRLKKSFSIHFKY